MRSPRCLAAVALSLTALLTGCDLSDEAPVAVPVGPTAAATALPQAPSTAAADIQASYDDAVDRIDALLAEDGRAPIDVIRGTIEETGATFDLQVLSLQTTELSLVLHLQLVPTDGQPLDLSSVDGGLSGELGEGNRTIADIALRDEASDVRVLPTVYRPDVGTEDVEQRCMCAALPLVVPPDGVRLTAHYVRPEGGFRSVVVEVPGAEPSAAIGTGGR